MRACTSSPTGGERGLDLRSLGALKLHHERVQGERLRKLLRAASHRRRETIAAGRDGGHSSVPSSLLAAQAKILAPEDFHCFLAAVGLRHPGDANVGVVLDVGPALMMPRTATLWDRRSCHPIGRVSSNREPRSLAVVPRITRGATDEPREAD